MLTKMRQLSIPQRILLGLVSLVTFACCFFVYDATVDRSGWIEKNGVYYYRDFHARKVTGWQEIGGRTYYFGQDKVMRTHWQDIDANRYYFGADGAMDTGWLDIDGNRYYFDETGIMAMGWTDVGDERYFFGTDGTLQIGWQDIDGNRYYLGTDGVMQISWLDIDGNRYFFDESGAMHTGWLNLGTGIYYLDEAGHLVTGRQTLEGKSYYFQESGAAYTGWEEDGQTKRYYSEDGVMQVGWLELDNKRYYFDETGTMVQGWLTQGEYNYYLQEDGSAAVGPVKIGGYQYYFTPAGIQVVLVNRRNTVPPYYKRDLVIYTEWNEVQAICLEPLKQMIADCEAAGYPVEFNSGYRSMETQEAILEQRTYEYMDRGYDFGQARAKALTSVAVPGTSEHHLGLAVDLLNVEEQPPCHEWLYEHCWEYGFILRYTAEKEYITGFVDEPWHFRYVGKEVALDMQYSGLCLEEYLGAYVHEE